MHFKILLKEKGKERKRKQTSAVCFPTVLNFREKKHLAQEYICP